MTHLDRIISLVDEGKDRTIEIRRDIHQHPELAFKEERTAALVRRELEQMGIPYEISPVATGTIATIDSGKPGKLLLLRADMDALPIQEQTDLPFASEVPDVMHACGHDVHTANLLAVARVLNAMKDAWSGRIRLVFQPAEEHGGGGREMIKAGLLDELPDACLAMHVDTKQQGVITIGRGSVNAFSDSYLVTIHGKAAHSQNPPAGVDAVQIAATVITALYQIVAKNIDPLEHSTLNVGTISGGLAGNIVADKVEFRVMTRNATREARAAMFESIERLSKGIAQTMGGTAELRFHEGYAAVYNDDVLSGWVADLIKDHADALYDGIGAIPDKFMRDGNVLQLGAEDFGFYAQKAPSCFIRMSTGDFAPAHSGDFKVDENWISLMTRVMCLAAVEFQNETRELHE